MNKFALVIIGIVAAMAVLIALPSATQQPVAGDLEIDYSKQRLSKIGNDFVATKVELLSISNDGSATYSETDPRLKILPVEERFTVSGDDYRKLRDLILETGFIEIPRTDYLEVAGGIDEYTKYRLTVRSGDSQKTFNWVDAYEGTVPYLIETAGSSLDAIAEHRP
ncbi:MAG: hypothetical protein ACREAY_06635 [Nitrososphaera sp.]|uniref:hypothetical protein n=1 Tax=Nitrososphaera sp. TaxID=1971748 RepID=UPI003D6EFA76